MINRSMIKVDPRSVYLGFLNVTNSLLLDLVSTVSSVWSPGEKNYQIKNSVDTLFSTVV